jgi:4-amino-4-deoxy-L-arabinose transferase-like glycosyltransferase
MLALNPPTRLQSPQSPIRAGIESFPLRVTLTLAVVTALVIRLIVMHFATSGLTDPSRGYEQFGWEMGWVARSIALGLGFSSPFIPSTGPTALVPPLFPYLLAGIFRVFGLYSANSGLVVLSLNSLFSALTCIPIYFTAQYSLGDRAARFAAWSWVLYPFAIYFSATMVWDYALTALLFATCFCILQRLHLHHGIAAWAGLGVLYGVTTLSNPSVLTVFPFLLLYGVLRIRRVGGDWLRRGVITTVALLAVLAPWGIRNYRILHLVCPVRDGFWLEFWSGNTGDTFESNPAWTHPASNPIEMQKYQSSGETAYLAQKHVMAAAWVHQHPISFLAVSLRRAIRFWTGFWSFNPRYLQKEFFDIPNLFFCTSITILMIIGLRRSWRHDRRATLPYLALLAIFPFTYYLSHSSMDYRQPIEPEVIILASLGIFGIRNSREAAAENVEEAAPTQIMYEDESLTLASR